MAGQEWPEARRKQFPNLLQRPIPHGAFKGILCAVRQSREEIQPRALLNFVNRFNVRPEIGFFRRTLPKNESRRFDAGRLHSLRLSLMCCNAQRNRFLTLCTRGRRNICYPFLIRFESNETMQSIRLLVP